MIFRYKDARTLTHCVQHCHMQYYMHKLKYFWVLSGERELETGMKCKFMVLLVGLHRNKYIKIFLCRQENPSSSVSVFNASGKCAERCW